MRISSFVAALAASLALGGAAYADGLPSKYAAPVDSYVPTPSWAGLYLGVSAGVGFSSPKFSDSDDYVCWDYQTCADAQAVGGLLGGSIGYNWQRGNLVVGLEGDISWASIDAKSKTYIDPGDNSYMQSRIDGIATIRARVGYATGTNLFYLTGGVAFVDAKHQAISGGKCSDSASGSFCSDDWHTGFTAGGGYEAMLGGNWSLKAEYLYIGTETESHVNPDAAPYTYGFADNIHIARIGLNYKLGSNCCATLESFK